MDDITKKLVLIFTLASLTLDVQCAPRGANHQQHDVTTKSRPISAVHADPHMTPHQSDDVIQTYRVIKLRQDNTPPQALEQQTTERQNDAPLPTHCQPVSNEVLWQKLDTHAASSTYRHRFSSTGDELFTGGVAAPGEGPAESAAASSPAGRTIRNKRGTTGGSGAFTIGGQKRIRRSLQVSKTESTAAAPSAKISSTSVVAESRIPGASKQSKQSAHYFTRVHSSNSSNSQLDMTEWAFVSEDDATRSEENKGVNLSISSANNSSLHGIIKSRQIRSSKPFSTGGVLHGRRSGGNSSDTRSGGKVEKQKASAAGNRNKTQINAAGSGGKNSKIQLKTGETGVKRYETWQCQLETHWKRMPEDLFPPFVETGRCAQKTCMMGMYACVPKYYVIKVLRRIEAECNPLMLIGQQNMTSSSPEDAWVLFDYSVIVGCDCSKRRKTGKFSISRTSDDDEDIVTVV